MSGCSTNSHWIRLNVCTKCMKNFVCVSKQNDYNNFESIIQFFFVYIASDSNRLSRTNVVSDACL